MAWEQRGTHRYYYSKKRVNGRVISQYWGREALAQRLAEFDSAERQAMKRLYAIENDLPSDDTPPAVVEFTALVAALTRAVLVVNGYHQHKGQWRKNRARP